MTSSPFVQVHNKTIAHVVWIMVAVGTLAMLAAAVPLRFQMLLDDTYGFGPPLARMGISLRYFAFYFLFWELLLAVSAWSIGIVIAWRKGDDWFALLSAISLMLIGFVPPLMNGLIWANDGWTLPIVLLRMLCFTGLIVLFSLFPNGRFAHRWLRYILIGWTINAVISLLFFPEVLADTAIMPKINTQSDAFLLIYQVLWFLPVMAAQWYRYRQVATAVEQQQTKWVVWGFTIPVLISFFNAILLLGIPSLRTDPVSNTVTTLTLGVLLLLSTLLIPFSLAFAIFRYRLWQIDIILNRTLVYGGMTGLVTIIYVLLVTGFGTLAVSEQSHLTGWLVATVLVVWGIRPLHHKWQAQVDKWLPPVASINTNATKKKKTELTWLQTTWVFFLLLTLVLFGAGLMHQGQNGFWQQPSAEVLAAAPLLANPFENDFFVDKAFYPFVLVGAYIQAAVFVLVGLFLFWRKSSDIMAVLASWMLIAIGLGFTPTIVFLPVLEPAWHLPTSLFQSALFGAAFLFLCLFPNGRFYPNWTRIAAIIWLCYVCLWLLFPQLNLHRATTIWPAVFFVGIVWLGVAAQLLRYRHISTVDEKQQTKWVIAGFAIANLGLLGIALLLVLGTNQSAALLTGIILTLALLPICIPLSIGVALLRYRLWQIDIILNRTLVYGSLTAAIILVYGLVVGGFSLLWRSQNNLLIPLLATGLIATLFQPARERLQRAVNKMTFGDRDDPAAVLAQLSQRLKVISQPDAILPAIVETVAQALKLPYVAIVLSDKDIMAETGIHFDAPLQTFPLVYQTVTIGQLQVAARSPGEQLNEADEQVLRQVALQAGTAVHAIRLTHDLQQSRIRIVTMREEERRRLHHDLHDELGPLIASQGLKLAAVRELLPSDPETAMQLLDDVLVKNENTVAHVRRLVYDLRSPTLDELGLAGAIREHVENSTQTGLHVTITTSPATLPPLPAAVEAAAYRIVLEAFTNIVRHAEAERCEIKLEIVRSQTLALSKSLRVCIADDGIGLQENGRHGIGLISMRERAEEVGGLYEIVSTDPGVRITAVLPLSA